MSSIPPIQRTYQTSQHPYKDRWGQRQLKKKQPDDKPTPLTCPKQK